MTRILILLAVIFSVSAQANDRSGPTNPPQTVYSTSYSGDDNGSTIQGILISAAVVGIVLCVKSKCWEQEKPDPLPDPGPAILTPDNLSDKPVFSKK